MKVLFMFLTGKSLHIFCNAPVDATSIIMFVTETEQHKVSNSIIVISSFSIKFLLQFQCWHWHIYGVLTSKKDVHQKFCLEKVSAFSANKINYQISLQIN